jgi:hypothetical protein
MLRAFLLANLEILPQARQGRYVFNRIGRSLPVMSWSSRSNAADHLFIKLGTIHLHYPNEVLLLFHFQRRYQGSGAVAVICCV